MLGSRLTVDGVIREIVGVMPAARDFPRAEVRLWVPAVLDPNNRADMWGYSGAAVIGRLRPGVTLAAANSDLNRLIPRIQQSFPWRMPDAWGDGLILGQALRLDAAQHIKLTAPPHGTADAYQGPVFCAHDFEHAFGEQQAELHQAIRIRIRQRPR